MSYGLDERGSIPDRDKRLFSPPCPPDRLWGPPTLLANTQGRLPPGREANHSPPPSADVVNDGAVPPLAHVSSWRGA
jgi:hypothetical protein